MFLFLPSISNLPHGTFFCKIHTVRVEPKVLVQPVQYDKTPSDPQLGLSKVVIAKNSKMVLQGENFTTREFLQSNQSCYLNSPNQKDLSKQLSSHCPNRKRWQWKK